jgi:hypothetical protein
VPRAELRHRVQSARVIANEALALFHGLDRQSEKAWVAPG